MKDVNDLRNYKWIITSADDSIDDGILIEKEQREEFEKRIPFTTIKIQELINSMNNLKETQQIQEYEISILNNTIRVLESKNRNIYIRLKEWWYNVIEKFKSKGMEKRKEVQNTVRK